jgi:hypothetical protein
MCMMLLLMDRGNTGQDQNGANSQAALQAKLALQVN